MKAKFLGAILTFAAFSLEAGEPKIGMQPELVAQAERGAPFNYSAYRNQVYRDYNYRYSNPYGYGVTGYPYYSNPYYYYNPDVYYQSRERFMRQGDGFIDPAADPHDFENDNMYEKNLRSMRENR